MKISIIGAGNLGLSIAQGLIYSDTVSKLYLTKRAIKTIENYANQKSVFVGTDNTKALKNSNIVIFAVQPRHFSKVLTEVKDFITNDHLVVSVVTGFKISQIETLIGHDKNIIRAMPNTAISIGKSMTCICSNKNGEKQVNIALNIFDKLGTTILISEEQMQAATVICASGIAFWMRLIRASTQGAIQLGFESNEALEMSMQTCLGAATLLLESGNHPEQEIDRVTTPGGCTIEGLNHMEHQGLSAAVIRGLVTSYEKITEISNK